MAGNGLNTTIFLLIGKQQHLPFGSHVFLNTQGASGFRAARSGASGLWSHDTGLEDEGPLVTLHSFCHLPDAKKSDDMNDMPRVFVSEGGLQNRTSLGKVGL